MPALGARAHNEIGNPAVNVALQWNNAALVAIRNAGTPPTIAARVLAVAHAAMYDAWAAYDPVAAGSIPGAPSRQPQSQNSELNKASAVTYAAYRTLMDLLPSQATVFNTLIGPNNLAYDPSITTTNQSTPPGVGNAAAAAELAFRHGDGSNQLANYADYTGYQPVNSPTAITDPNHWQPLQNSDGTVQTFLTPFWGQVIPFALQSASQFRPGPPPLNGNWLYSQRVRDVIQQSVDLDNQSNMSAVYWADTPGSGTPAAPGHWNLIAEAISTRDQHTLDQDVTMFFALNGAELDASIAVWDAKRFYDFIRPISAIHYFYAGLNWSPLIDTPPYPEFPSDISAYATAGAEILRLFVGNDVYLDQVSVNSGSLGWFTFSQIAENTEWSTGPGGTQFFDAELQGAVMGRAVADVAWNRYTQLLAGKQ
jgi:hypothetical protein